MKMNTVNQILEDYAIFFVSGEYSTTKIQEEFEASEYYSKKDNTRYYDRFEMGSAELNEGEYPIDKETFDEYVNKHLKQTEKIFQSSTLNGVNYLKSANEQNAFLFALIAHLQSFIQILIKAEDSRCRNICTYIENSRDFILNTFSDQLALNKADYSLSTKRPALSSFFRGIEKLRFDLNKQEVASLFLLLIDSGILKHPVADPDLAKFLDNNCKYKDEDSENFIDIKSSKITISKLIGRDIDIEAKIQIIKDRINSTLIRPPAKR